RWVNRPLKAVMPTNRNVFFVKRGDQDYGWRLALLDDARMKSHPELLQQLEEKIQGDSAWYLESGQWIAVTNNEGKFFAEESAVGNGKGYLRTEKGELFEVIETGISRLKTPGTCEAIAASPTGTLLASFRGLGVFELKEEWQQLLTSPYSNSQRDYEVRLAAQVGCIALAVRPQSQRQLSGANPAHNSTATLVCNPVMWISQGQEWKRVSLPAAE
ncbi:MAG: hypothetical protein KBH45_15905, partial [Verrucomicrobia bacterium]|nr:hypothetical protein [Verrucomicrobiota bacterium]